MTIDPDNKEEVQLFLDRSKSGDPLRDWYSELDLADSLRMAYAYIQGMEWGIDQTSPSQEKQE